MSDEHLDFDVPVEAVQVIVRIRPPIQNERNSSPIWKVHSNDDLMNDEEELQHGYSLSLDPKTNNTLKRKSMTNNVSDSKLNFDHVFYGSDNRNLYHKSIRDMIICSMEGFNATIFAYGQTSSGKTYTMKGNDNQPGVITLAVQEIFSYIANSRGKKEFLLRASYFEIYNETIVDLLSPEQQDLRIHEDKKKRTFVHPLKEEIVTSVSHVLKLIEKGEKNRHISSTDYNEHSSRSHVIFQIVIESRTLGAKESITKQSYLNLIDLAGSEKASENFERRTESSYINKSLLTLGAVISKLADNKRSSHVPFRDSKLTRILQYSLSGDSKVSVICTLSPVLRNYEESTSTLNFAKTVKRVLTKARKNSVMDDKALLQRYKHEIQDLKDKLAETNEQYENKIQTEREMIAAERQKNEEEMEEQRLLRTALKERIEHLTKMILTSGNMSSMSSNQGLGNLSKSLSQMNIDNCMEKLNSETSSDTLKSTIRSYEKLLAEKDDTIRELRFRVDDLTAKLYHSQWITNIATKNNTSDVDHSGLDLDTLRLEVASEKQIRKDLEYFTQEKIAEQNAIIGILRSELSALKEENLLLTERKSSDLLDSVYLPPN